MSTKEVPNWIGTRLCEALDLDPKDIVSIQLYVRAGSIPVVQITRSVLDVDLETFFEAVEQHQLVSHSPEEVYELLKPPA